MQVSLGPVEGLKRQVTVTIPAERVTESYKKKLNKIKQTAKLDGFRPGKVPNKVVESRFGASIQQEVVSELLRETLFEALREHDLTPAGMPNITDLKAEKGQAMEYIADFEVFPEIDLKILQGVAMEKIESEMVDADVDSILEKLRKQRAEWIDVERACQNEDQVLIDFDGECNGEEIKGGKGADMPLVLGSGSMIPGFEEGIVGMKQGEEKIIDVIFPQEYHEENLKGKKAQFTIKVKKVSEAKLPELDDKLADVFGIKEGGLDAMKVDMQKHMGVELENGLKMMNKMATFDRLLEINKFDVPQALIEQEMESMHKQAQQQAAQKQGDVPPLMDEARKYLQEPASRRVKLGLLINEVIKVKELKADPDKVKAMIERMAGSYENPQEFLQWYMTDKERVAQIESVVLEDDIAHILMDEADVTIKKMSYDDVMKAQQTTR